MHLKSDSHISKDRVPATNQSAQFLPSLQLDAQNRSNQSSLEHFLVEQSWKCMKECHGKLLQFAVSLSGLCRQPTEKTKKRGENLSKSSQATAAPSTLELIPTIIKCSKSMLQIGGRGQKTAAKFQSLLNKSFSVCWIMHQIEQMGWTPCTGSRAVLAQQNFSTPLQPAVQPLGVRPHADRVGGWH